jgi:hypothetical protein
MPFAIDAVCSAMRIGMQGVEKAVHGAGVPRVGTIHGTDDVRLSDNAPSAMLVACTVWPDPFTPSARETGPDVALLKRNVGAAFRLATMRKEKKKTG